jgi:type II secretion system protein N
MRLFTSKNKKWFGYILYCLILTLGLLHFRFPSDALRDYLQISANNLNTPLILSINRIRPWPSFGLKLGKTKISLKDKPTVKLFRADSLLISPAIWSLLQGKSKFCFDCLAYDGVLKGCVYFIKNSIKAPLAASIELKDISLGAYDDLPVLIGRHVRGGLGGTIIYRGQYNFLIDGTGEADLRISNGQV